LLGAHCVGVLLSQPRARLQPCFNACKAGRQDGRRSEMRAGTPVDTPMFNSAWGRDTKHCRTVIATEGHVSRRPGRSRGGMRHTNTLVGVDRRADQSLDAPRMLNYAGDELISQLGQAVFIILIEEQVVTVLVPEAEVRVQ